MHIAPVFAVSVGVFGFKLAYTLITPVTLANTMWRATSEHLRAMTCLLQPGSCNKLLLVVSFHVTSSDGLPPNRDGWLPPSSFLPLRNCLSQPGSCGCAVCRDHAETQLPDGGLALPELERGSHSAAMSCGGFTSAARRGGGIQCLTHLRGVNEGIQEKH